MTQESKQFFSEDKKQKASVHDAWQDAMLCGHWARAWQICDRVLGHRDKRFSDDPALPYHQRWLWDGRSFVGKHVLVRCYHGLGDTLQFARFLPRLNQHAKSVTLEVQPELCDILDGRCGVSRIVAFDRARPQPPSECDMDIMELPHALRVLDVATGFDYLSPLAPSCDSRRVEGPLRIGLCWAAGDWDPARSLPAALLFGALSALDVRLFSLQRGPAANALAPSLAQQLENPRDLSMRVADTAALLATLDVVVTVDGFVAHLAGAMGRPAYVLLKHHADWRWMAGAATAWYPRASLFRQQRAGDWAVPVADLAGAIARFPL